MTLLSAALAVAVTFAPHAAAQDAAAGGADKWDARVTAASGDVVVHPADGGEESAAEADMPLEEGDRITTGAGASAEISLDGGSLITLQENSDFTLEKTAKADSTFFLSLGSLLAKIEHLGDQRLQVRTPSAVAAVRGTEFGVENQAGGQSSVGVFDEGRVEVKGDTGQTQVLSPNQETSVRRGEAPQRAFALRRFAARRALMRAAIRRLAIVHRGWRKLSPIERRERRQKVLARLRARRQNMRRQFQRQRREQLDDRRRRRQFRGRPRRKTAPKLKKRPLRRRPNGGRR